jgi:hypothetical protein
MQARAHQIKQRRLALVLDLFALWNGFAPNCGVGRTLAKRSLLVSRITWRSTEGRDSDVRWTHLPDKETARRFANLLIKEFVSSGRYSDSTRTCLEVKDDSGALLLSIPFPHIA